MRRWWLLCTGIVLSKSPFTARRFLRRALLTCDLRRMTRPVPLRWSRSFAPEWVLSLGNLLLPRYLSGLGYLLVGWRQDNAQEAPLHIGRPVYGRQILQVLQHAVQDRPPCLRVGHLAAAEHHRHLNSVAFLQKALSQTYLALHVVPTDVRPHAHLMNDEPFLVFATLALLLGLLISPRAEV